VKLIAGTGLPPFLLGLYDYAWFIGFGVAFAVYLALRKLAPRT
jgi:NCS1 family nucleobase:cation symporter-1